MEEQEHGWNCMECLDCGHQFEVEPDGYDCPKCHSRDVEFSNWKQLAGEQ